MGETIHHIDKLRKRIDDIIQERPSHKEILEFLREVMTEQHKIRPKVKTDPAKFGKENCRGLMEGFPLLDKRNLPLDIAAATSLLKELCKVLSRNQGASRDARRINQAVRRKEIDLTELFKHTGIENREYIHALSVKLGVREGFLYFLAENSIKPMLEAYADELKGCVDQETWGKGYCPICGSLPCIAELRGEGERFLVCSSCNFEWRFKRLMCPFCESEDHKNLRYFYREREGKANRVDVCDKCKAYIKTIEVGERSSDFIPFVEDAGTLYMDMIAQAEGYKRRNNSWGIDQAFVN